MKQKIKKPSRLSLLYASHARTRERLLTRYNSGKTFRAEHIRKMLIDFYKNAQPGENMDLLLQRWNTRLGKKTNVGMLTMAFRSYNVTGCENDLPVTFWQFYENWKRQYERYLHRADDLLTPEMIDDSIEQYQARHPKNKCPSTRPILIEYGKAANGRRTWQDVANAIRNKWFGLTEANCPYKDFMEFTMLRGHRAEHVPYTVDNIRETAIIYHQKTGRWLTTAQTEMISWGSLKGNQISVRGLDKVIYHKSGGLTPENCPYNSLSRLLAPVKKAYKANKKLGKTSDALYEPYLAVKQLYETPALTPAA